jgi:hypothetical protein
LVAGFAANFSTGLAATFAAGLVVGFSVFLAALFVALALSETAGLLFEADFIESLTD